MFQSVFHYVFTPYFLGPPDLGCHPFPTGAIGTKDKEGILCADMTSKSLTATQKEGIVLQLPLSGCVLDFRFCFIFITWPFRRKEPGKFLPGSFSTRPFLRLHQGPSRTPESLLPYPPVHRLRQATG